MKDIVRGFQNGIAIRYSNNIDNNSLLDPAVMEKYDRKTT